MAAPRAFLCLVARQWNGKARGIHSMSESMTPGSSPKRRTLLEFLADHFQDVQTLREYLLQKQIRKVNQENRSYSGIQERFQDKEWILQHERGHFLAEFQKFQNIPVEAVDASGCAINYQGMSNILPLKELRSLSLQRCPNVDDWCLGRLHVLAASLQELSLAGCPRVSERGLACLHHLQNLRRLDISGLPAVSHPGLTQILVEEMLPHCEVLGVDWTQSLNPGADQQPEDTPNPLSS